MFGMFIRYIACTVRGGMCLGCLFKKLDFIFRTFVYHGSIKFYYLFLFPDFKGVNNLLVTVSLVVIIIYW